MSRFGPDFMCIGLQKAGTRWLYDQLDTHPDFEMPPFKELHYFSYGMRSPGLAKVHGRIERNLDGLNHWRTRHHRRILTASDVTFVHDAAKLRDHSGGIDEYAALFTASGITGDITPAYSLLPEETIRNIFSNFPDLKVMLLLREPVARACSHLSMGVRLKLLPPEILDSVAQVADWFSSNEVQDRSRPSLIWKKWSYVFPPEQIRFFFFEDICERPAWLIGEIIEFLGGDPAKPTALPSDHNRKAERAIPVPEAARAYLAEALRDETLACAELFGGHALAWPG